MTGVLAALLSLCLAPVALAGKPHTFELPPFPTVVDPPGTDCPAAIAPDGLRWSDAGGHQFETDFDNGTVIFTGTHPDQVTNVRTGKSLIVKAQGIFTSVPQPDGTTKFRMIGVTGFNFAPGDVGPGDIATPRIYIFTGDATGVFGVNGSVTSFKWTGRVQDLCAMIA